MGMGEGGGGGGGLCRCRSEVCRPGPERVRGRRWSGGCAVGWHLAVCDCQAAVSAGRGGRVRGRGGCDGRHGCQLGDFVALQHFVTNLHISSRRMSGGTMRVKGTRIALGGGGGVVTLRARRR
jgi:hypothetical protein